MEAAAEAYRGWFTRLAERSPTLASVPENIKAPARDAELPSRMPAALVSESPAMPTARTASRDRQQDRVRDRIAGKKKGTGFDMDMD